MNNDPQGERGASEKSKVKEKEKKRIGCLSRITEKEKLRERKENKAIPPLFNIQSLYIAAAAAATSTLSFFIPSLSPTPHIIIIIIITIISYITTGLFHLLWILLVFILSLLLLLLHCKSN